MKHLYPAFKSAIETHEEEPPEFIWSEIESRLDKEDILKYKTKYFKLLRIAICVLCLGICLHLDNDLNLSSVKNSNAVNHFIMKDSSAKLEKKYIKSALPASVHQPGNTGYTYPFTNYKNRLVANSADTFELFNNSNNVFFESSEGSKNAVNMKRSNETAGIQNEMPLHEGTATNLLSLMKDSLIKLKPSVINVSSTKLPAIKKVMTSRFNITALVSNNIIKNHLDEIYEIDHTNESELKERETKKFSLTAGLMAEYRIKKVLLQSGISYTELSSVVAPSYIDEENYNGSSNFLLPTTYGVAVIDKNDFPGLTSTDSLHVTSFSKQRISYITFPANFKYNIISKGKLNCYVSAGAGINLITGSKIDLSLMHGSSKPKQISPSINGLKGSFITANGGIDVSYMIHKNISLTLQPSFIYSITSLNKNTPVKNSISMLRAAAGIKISL